MNRTLNNLLILLVLSFAIACSGKKETTEVSVDDAWPEMDEFHMIMAESFHPYKDSANMEPAKANAAEMASVAGKWLNAPLPEKVNNEDVKATLKQLKSDTEAFAQTVQGGDSTQIGESLTSLHDLFHKLQEAWYSGGSEEKHDHKH
jgi:hypothetical protein